MLEAFLEEGFLCPEIIFPACLTCPLKLLEPLCGPASEKQMGLQTSLFVLGEAGTASLESLGKPKSSKTMIIDTSLTKIR